jgi:hypothetical protein
MGEKREMGGNGGATAARWWCEMMGGGGKVFRWLGCDGEERKKWGKPVWQ